LGAGEHGFGGGTHAEGARGWGHPQKTITWSGPVSGAITFGYNTDFRVNAQSLNGGTALSFGYDNDGLLNLAGALTVVPDPQNGRLSATTLGTVTDAYGYDTNGLLASYAATYSGTPVYTESIVSRDLNGRITERTDALAGASHDWKYVYDPAGRLTDVTEDGTAVSHYGYDGDDNRTTFTNLGGTVNPSYDVQDRLGTYGSTTYAFSANGELVSKTVGTQVTSYTYDALGNLLNVTLPVALPDGAQTIDYIVDGQNRRVGRKVNGTLVQGWLYQDQLRPVAQLDSSGTNVVARFVYGSKANVPDYMVTSGGTYRILSDHLGSPRAVVDVASGNLIETINFDEFGNESDALAGTLPAGYVRIPFGFVGGLDDPDTGLVRFGARDYDATTGRWTSKDPWRFRGGMNLYGYVVSDPVNVTDPTGFAGFSPGGGGPWHPPPGTPLACTMLDSCADISRKIDLLDDTIQSHEDWDQSHGVCRHEDEIGDLNRARANCVAIHQAKCVNQPQQQPVPNGNPLPFTPLPSPEPMGLPDFFPAFPEFIPAL
jgi:RHS repeat-associated protein